MPPNMSVRTMVPCRAGDLGDGGMNIGTALFEIVVGADRTVSDSVLRSDDMLQRKFEFFGKTTMGDQNQIQSSQLKPR